LCDVAFLHCFPIIIHFFIRCVQICQMAMSRLLASPKKRPIKTKCDFQVDWLALLHKSSWLPKTCAHNHDPSHMYFT
jgi:hypothetical protein